MGEHWKLVSVLAAVDFRISDGHWTIQFLRHTHSESVTFEITFLPIIATPDLGIHLTQNALIPIM